MASSAENAQKVSFDKLGLNRKSNLLDNRLSELICYQEESDYTNNLTINITATYAVCCRDSIPSVYICVSCFMFYINL